MDIVNSFIDRLRAFESGGELEPLLSLFDSGVTLRTASHADTNRGIDGARAFWERYRGAFRDIRSEFQFRIETAKAAALEWSSDGTLSDGASVQYQGVTVLEINGGKITSVRVYYDTSAFTAHGHKVKPAFDPEGRATA